MTRIWPQLILIRVIRADPAAEYSLQLKLSNQNDAARDKHNARDSGNADFLDGQAEQSKMIDYQRHDHLAGDEQTKRHRDSQPRNKDYPGGHKESTEQPAEPCNCRSIPR